MRHSAPCFIKSKPKSVQHTRLPSIIRSPATASAQQQEQQQQKLADIEMRTIISVQGFIEANVPTDTKATVFGIFDEAKTLQYIGFSSNFQASIRTVFSRRPDRAFYYKALHLPRLDQDEMLGIRAAWFEENFGPPPGNKLALERAAWQQPVESAAISERGRQQAAEETVRELLAKIKTRGCKEDFTPDPDLLGEGKVDFLAIAALTEEQVNARKAAAAAATKLTRSCPVSVDGISTSFDLAFQRVYPTKGGHMIDCTVTFLDKETTHRVIIGKDYTEPLDRSAEDAVQATFEFLLKRKVPRQTEGILLSSEFTINYFSLSQVEQFYKNFAEEYANCQVGSSNSDGDGNNKALPDEQRFWRFNRIHDYGAAKLDDPKKFAKQMSPMEGLEEFKLT
jgi:hypothetical protein